LPTIAYLIYYNNYFSFLKVSTLLVYRFGNTYGYGFAFARKSPYTPLFNMELFGLQNDFIISTLTHKWTEEKVKCELMDNFEEEQNKGKLCETLIRMKREPFPHKKN